jgi:SAM-dependent methyltransferase
MAWRFGLIWAGLWAGCAFMAVAQTAPATDYVPQRGQIGKDVIWVPTPVPLIEKMLSTARVTSEDRLFDLGAGDGIIAITAAKRHGAQAVGIEYNPDMAEFARRQAREAGVSDKVRIITGDIFKEDFSSASVVTLYLLPDLNMRLRPTILKMKPGTRVVSHAFTMGEWEADEVIAHENFRAYYWLVPAQLEGEWMLRGAEGGPMKLTFHQQFQKIGGLLSRGSQTLPLIGAKLRGEDLSFQYMTPDRRVHTFSGRIQGRQISGTVTTDNLITPVEGGRL